jgi:hypothetical protein
MKKWIPTLSGLFIGVLFGVYLLCQPAEAIPSFIRFRVEHISVFLGTHLTSDSDIGLDLLGPVCLFFCALLGALIGFGTGALLKMTRRHSL